MFDKALTLATSSDGYTAGLQHPDSIFTIPKPTQNPTQRYIPSPKRHRVVSSDQRVRHATVSSPEKEQKRMTSARYILCGILVLDCARQDGTHVLGKHMITPRVGEILLTLPVVADTTPCSALGVVFQRADHQLDDSSDSVSALTLVSRCASGWGSKIPFQFTPSPA